MDQQALAQLVERLVDERFEQKVGERFDALEAQLGDIQTQLERVASGTQKERVTILAFSGDMDKLMSTFIIATGAVAMGMEVHVYFTFWGLMMLKKQKLYAGKPIAEKMMQFMLPGGPQHVGPSKMNMMGMGRVFFKKMMAKNHVETLPDLLALAKEMEVRLIACQMTMGVMGISREELIDDVEYGGVATYLESVSDAKVSLFI